MSVSLACPARRSLFLNCHFDLAGLPKKVFVQQRGSEFPLYWDALLLLRVLWRLLLNWFIFARARSLQSHIDFAVLMWLVSSNFTAYFIITKKWIIIFCYVNPFYYHPLFYHTRKRSRLFCVQEMRRERGKAEFILKNMHVHPDKTQCIINNANIFSRKKNTQCPILSSIQSVKKCSAQHWIACAKQRQYQ